MSAEAFAGQFDSSRLARVARLGALLSDRAVTDVDAPSAAAVLAETEVLVTSWGPPHLSAERLRRMPRLRAVFHCAGTVRGIVSDEFWRREIVITSAADANAVPVAEFTFAAIVLAGKRAFELSRLPLAESWAARTSPAFDAVGNHGGAVGIVGFSRIGRRVVELLRTLRGVEVLVADPFADPLEVAAAGARLVPLEAMVGRVRVLSIHAPALPSTRHLIGRAELAALPTGATVINTARGSLVDHDALLAECGAGRLHAVLDVTEPEPLAPDSPFLALPNVFVTPHIAGSLGNETGLMVDFALDQFEAYRAGLPLSAQVLPQEFEISA